MKLLFLTNLYSGLKDSIIKNNWDPKGMPAIYLFLEFLSDKNIPFDYIFINRKKSISEFYLTKFPKSKFYLFKPKNNNISFKILDQYFFYKDIFYLLSTIDLKKYDIIYLDRANVGLIPFIKKIYKGKIVLRLHGILNYNYLFSNSLKFKIINWFLIYSYKQKVDYIIATKDGSQTDLFLNKHVNKKSQYTSLINGVNLPENIENKINSKISYLFLGRFEKDKGILEVIEVFKKLAKNFKSSFELLIIGDGSLFNDIYNDTKNINNIKLFKSISHNKMESIFKKVDVTLSLNFIGNISNVVLESIANETAIITFHADLIQSKDVESNKFLESNVIYIDRYNIIEDLYNIIVKQIKNKSILEKYKTLSKVNLKPKLLSWEKRFNIELDILKSILCEKNE